MVVRTQTWESTRREKLTQALTHQHLCKRCLHIYFCERKDRRQCVVWNEQDQEYLLKSLHSDGTCGFCTNLTDEQCALLREPKRHLYAHHGLRGEAGKRVARALNIPQSEVVGF